MKFLVDWAGFKHGIKFVTDRKAASYKSRFSGHEDENARNHCVEDQTASMIFRRFLFDYPLRTKKTLFSRSVKFSLVGVSKV